MHVSLTVVHFLERLAIGFADSVAIIEKPEQSIESLGQLTFRDLA
ncbi:MAG: hypothetical protein ACSLE6_18545 [Mycobacterium sp.]